MKKERTRKTLQTLQAPSSQWTFDECAGRRPAIEAVAARPRRGAGANEGLKPRLSRCVAFAALSGAVRRPPRCCPAAARRCAQQLRRCQCVLQWCPVPAPPPSRGRCASSHGLLVLCARSAAGRSPPQPPQPARPLRAHPGNADSATTAPRSNTPLGLAA